MSFRLIRLHYQQLIDFGFIIYRPAPIGDQKFVTFLGEEDFVNAYIKNERVDLQRRRKNGEVVVYENVKIGINLGE